MRSFLLLLFVCTTVFGFSQSIKMKITGVTATAGEDVMAFETSDTTTITNGGGGSAIGSTIFEYIKFKKLQDASSIELFKRSFTGTVTADVTFEFYDAGATLFYKISVKDVRLTHFSFLSPECANCSKLYHQVWMKYQKIEVYDIINNTSIKYNLDTRTTY